MADNADLSSMTITQLRNTCKAKGMTPSSWDPAKIIFQIESNTSSDASSSQATPPSAPAPRGASGRIEPAELSADERVCVGLMRKHGVDSKKLEKLIDQSVNQAGAMIAEYDRTQKMPVQLAKAFLGGVFSGSVVHTNERDQRDLQIGPLLKIVQTGQIASYYIDDSDLGKGNGVQSRLTAIEERRSKAEANLKKVKQVLHDCAPVILEDVADSIKATGAAYTKLFGSLQKDVMAEVARLVQDLLSTAPGGGSAKALQPKSKYYPHLSDPEDPLFMIALLKDAQFAKKLLDAFAALIVSKVFGSEAKFAPLKSVERGVVKVYEKYDCRFDKLTDVARVTIVCADECVLRDVLKELKKAVEDGAVRIYRIKFRLGADYDAAEAGGYRDVLINMAFPPKDGEEEDGLHLVELQLNLAAFVDIKSGGGHASYSVGRILQAFDNPTTTYTGMATPDVVRDMQTGLIKKATVVGIDGAETEARMVEALGSHSVQLVELKLVSIAFSGTMGNLKWLAASAEHLAPTLKVLIVKKCGVKGPIPLEVGEFSHLAELVLNGNELDGERSIDHASRCLTFLKAPFFDRSNSGKAGKS
jgi:hypothetical protein